jgi:uncharacterized protein YgiM (DUF1202 family)
MKRTSILAFLVLSLSLAFADTATVQVDTNLREQPTRSSNIVNTVSAGDQVELISPKPRRGYFHVRTSGGDEGWLVARNVQVDPSGGTSDSGNTNHNPPDPQDLFGKLTAAKKPATGQSLVEGGQEVCGPSGDANDQRGQELNQNKNRTDQPDAASFVVIDWDSLKDLSASRINDFQGAPVTVEGFLSHRIAVENSGSGESTNCHLTRDDEVDWHMYLTRSPAQPISEAIIVETTPRTRPSHRWTTDGLNQFVDSNTKVRISGWLMYDFEHVGVIGRQRISAWEVHPVMRIEVQRDGQWVDLDAGQ